jgi:hypothetical protein
LGFGFAHFGNVAFIGIYNIMFDKTYRISCLIPLAFPTK